jgi:signal transduction histidine kinase
MRGPGRVAGATARIRPAVRRPVRKRSARPPAFGEAAMFVAGALPYRGGMQTAELPADEAERLAALRRYAVLDTTAEAAFDEVTQLASVLCGTPIALVSLIDAERQWFKARVGLDATETSRDVAFCTHAILQSGVFEVPDAALDLRFADNPLVTADPRIRFYAGAPLIDPDGHALGTLCVIDRVPRRLTETQRFTLGVLGRQVMMQLELRRRVVELARTGLELESARDRALAGVRAKDVFLANMGHELRTPLTAILGYAELLRERLAGEAEATEEVQAIARAGEHLVAVIDQILGLARLEQGEPEVCHEALDLAAVLAEVEATVRPLAQARGLELRLVAPASAPLRSDPTKLRQIAFNLVSNAIKFTERGSVELRLSVDGAGHTLAVTDTGIGIPADKLPLLFREFSRVHDDARYRGTGLGLALSRRYARLLGGDLDVDSAPGRGSVFTLRLPP